MTDPVVMHLDLSFLDDDEIPSLNEIGDMVGADGPGLLMVCIRCHRKRYIPADPEAAGNAAEHFAIDHEKCKAT